MQFKEFDWLSGNGIIDWLSGHGIMSHYTMPFEYGKRTREFLGAFLFPFQSSFRRF